MTLPPGDKNGDKESERARTDSSLRDERDRTDDELAARFAADDKTADTALRDERARRGAAVGELFARERRATDATLMLERANADDTTVDRAAINLIVHDLRSMLSTISLNAATIALAVEKSEPAQLIVGLANHIKRATAQSNLLLGDLQEIAATDDVRRLVRTNADICEVVRTAVEINRAAATASGITLTAMLPLAPLVVSLDASRFMRVVVNLLSNALKFTPEGGSITVSVTRSDDGIDVSVADTGPGIEPEEREAIFERFHQGRNARGRGAGLGLYIAREIVHAHGGTIAVESTPDRGSTFRIHLPA